MGNRAPCCVMAAEMTIPSRQPTINQAVEILMRIITRDERKAQLSWMRRHFGEDFAGQVEAKVKALWRKK